MTDVRVTVRMYSGLLGDCFLLRLFRGDPEPERERKADAHILIDCGILQRSAGEKDRMARVVDDIADTCGGRLDLVVVTHEHYDHIGGFGAAGGAFLQRIKIDRLWLAWTEDPADEDAQRLRALMGDSQRAVRFGIERLAALHPNREWALEGEALGLDDFIGPLAAAQNQLPAREIIAALKDKVGPGAITYLKPAAEAVRTPGPEGLGLDVVVLGPPKALNRLFQPGATKKGAETYFAARQDEARLAARSFAADEETAGKPFDARHRQLDEATLLDPDLPAPCRGDSAAAHKLWEIVGRYTSRGLGVEDAEGWRRIDNDWLSGASGLALQLDSDTNNTSLVLAFELSPGGEVMLFAADAQVGNWLSWHDPLIVDGKSVDRQPSAADLLSRTTLYKVGHHCSHNATLRALGLELMTHPDLVAMIPVVEEVANRRRWRMPAAQLYARLLERTSGRVLRGDRSPPFDAFGEPGPDASRVREKPGDATLGPLWIEYDAS